MQSRTDGAAVSFCAVPCSVTLSGPTQRGGRSPPDQPTCRPDHSQSTQRRHKPPPPPTPSHARVPGGRTGQYGTLRRRPSASRVQLSSAAYLRAASSASDSVCELLAVSRSERLGYRQPGFTRTWYGLWPRDDALPTAPPSARADRAGTKLREGRPTTQRYGGRHGGGGSDTIAGDDRKTATMSSMTTDGVK